MIALRLIREISNSACCRGRLDVLSPTDEVDATLFTMEKPWIPSSNGGRGGEGFKSRIRAGKYKLSPHTRPNGDKVWILSNPAHDVYKLDTDMPPSRRGKARFLILIHVGNYARDVVGCIAPGMSWRTNPDGSLMVTRSKDAMQRLHALLDGRKNMEIEIRAEDFVHT